MHQKQKVIGEKVKISHKYTHYNWLERPVFVAGQLKSGTSLFRRMLDGHPEMFTYPDAPFFRLLFQREYKTQRHMILDWLIGNSNVLQQPPVKLHQFDSNNEFVPIPVGYSNIPAYSVELSGHIPGVNHLEEIFSIKKYHLLLKEYLSVENTTRKEIIQATVVAAVNACLVDIKKNTLKRWAYLQPTTANTTIHSGVRENKEVNWFFKTFPKGQVLFILRNPFAVILSRRDHFQSSRSTNRLKKFIYLLNDAKIVRESFKELKQFERHYDEGKLKVVRYEDLTTNPRSSMLDICSYLGLSFSETMLHPTIFGVPCSVVTAIGFDGSKVNKTRIERWKNELSRFHIVLIDAMLTKGFGFHGSRWGYTRQAPLIPAIITKLFIIFPISAVLRIRFWLMRLRDLLFNAISFRYSKFVQLHFYSEDTRYDIAAARDWNSVHNRHFILEQLSEIIREKSLCGYKRVLDVGCRHALWTFALAHCSGEVVGIELIPEFVDMVNQQIKHLRVDNIKVIKDKLETYEPEEKFDLVHVRSVLHCDGLDRNKKIQKLINMLVPNGRLYVTYFGIGQLILSMIQKFRIKDYRFVIRIAKTFIATLIFRNLLCRKRWPFSFLTKKGFVRFLESNGLEIKFMGHLDCSIDGSLPARFGPFLREFDALCKRKDKQ